MGEWYIYLSYYGLHNDSNVIYDIYQFFVLNYLLMLGKFK